MIDWVEKLRGVSSIADDQVARVLVPILLKPTGKTTAGFPYLERRSFEEFRDRVPILFAMGQRVLEAQEKIRKAARELGMEAKELENLERAARVARQMAQTAAITAPTDLWLMRHILGVHRSLGITERLVRGEAIHPEFTEVVVRGERRILDGEQLAIDLEFLLSRGVVEQYDESYRIAGHRRVRELLERLEPLGAEEPVPATPLWRAAFGDEAGEVERLLAFRSQIPTAQSEEEQTHWVPTLEEVVTGYLLVPVVLGLRATGRSSGLRSGDQLRAEDLVSRNPEVGEVAIEILRAAGWARDGEGGMEITTLGERGLQRGPGPFGIIQTYVSYLERGGEILLEGRQKVWVQRGENIGASQDANRKTFQIANDALDRFCDEEGFSYSVFIEHAIGRGEATRQRFERSGEERIRYFGADLEDPAIDAAEEEQRAGRLPANMVFVRQADIGKPEILIEALKQEGVDPWGAVMLVGNGFHEVRGQSDQMMIEVFRGYHQAGILLLFTEENALSVDDLRATAWNSYHAGFKYVHEKSGQCLRPASPRPKPRLGPPLRAAWSECARAAGYVRMEEYGGRTRTIYPYGREGRVNPSISVNHFFVPASIAARLRE